VCVRWNDHDVDDDIDTIAITMFVNTNIVCLDGRRVVKRTTTKQTKKCEKGRQVIMCNIGITTHQIVKNCSLFFVLNNNINNTVPERATYLCVSLEGTLHAYC
jgi:hypothetical protein